MPKYFVHVNNDNALVEPDNKQIALADISTKDSIWDKQRHLTDQISTIYGYNSEFIKYSERMTECSFFLAFALTEDTFRLTDARFCRVRHCPVCQWRKSLLWKHFMYLAYEKIKSQHPTHRWLFLTLTLKNPDITDLRETIQHMNTSWRRLIKRKHFLQYIDGWIKTTEVTKGDDGITKAHPHFHIILLVKPSYFSRGYMSALDWARLWGDCLRVDYLPNVDIRTVKPKKSATRIDDDGVKSAIMETLKYAVKPADMIGNNTIEDHFWLYELTRQCFKLRFVDTGGALKNALKNDNAITDDDLVNVNQDDAETQTEEDSLRVVFYYSNVRHQYIYSPNSYCK